MIGADLYRRLPHHSLPQVWFTRVWTLQELLLARDPIVVCGPQYISWYQYERWINCNWYQYDYLDEKTAGPHYSLQRTINTRNNYISLKDRDNNRRKEDASQPPVRLIRLCHYLIENAARRDSSDDRDLVYSLRALMLELGLEPEAPDYNKNVRTVHEEFAITIIRRTNNLMLLTTATPSFRDGGLGWPSWVPNLARSGWSIAHTYSRLINYPSFRPGFKLSHQPGRITLEGTRFNPVKEVGVHSGLRIQKSLQDLELQRFISFGAAYWLNKVFELAQRAGTCPNGEPATTALLEAFWYDVGEEERRNIFPARIKATFGGDKVASPWLDEGMVTRMRVYVSGISDEIRRLLDIQRGQDGCCATIEEAVEFLAKSKDYYRTDDDSHDLEYIRRMCDYHGGFVPVALSNGCVGWGYGKYKEGSKVVFLYGCDLPYVVERCGQEYRFVGPVKMGGIPEGVWPPAEGTVNSQVELMTFV